MATKTGAPFLLLFFFVGFVAASTYQRTVGYADQVLVRWYAQSATPFAFATAVRFVSAYLFYVFVSFVSFLRIYVIATETGRELRNFWLATKRTYGKSLPSTRRYGSRGISSTRHRIWTALRSPTSKTSSGKQKIGHSRPNQTRTGLNNT